MNETATEFVTFMHNLYLAYPDLQNRSLYMTGESYAGKYLPAYSNALLDSNDRGDINVTFNLKATLVGDPYTAPLTQRTNTYKLPYALNVIDDSNMPQVAAMIRRCQEMTHTNLTQSAENCSDIIGYVNGVSGGVFPYDNRIFGYDWDPIEQPVDDYFNATLNPNITDVWNAIHVENSTKTPIFEMGSSGVADAFQDDNMIDYSSNVTSLFNRNSKVLIYAGEFDAQDGPGTQEPWLRRLDFPGKEAFWS